jgi:hypothetical protein
MGAIRISAHWCGIRLACRPADKKGGGLLANIKALLPSGGRGPVRVPTSYLKKTATQYVFKPQFGVWLKPFVTLLGRMPPDYQAWIITDEVPAFARFEGPLYPTGPVWRIELTSPRWPD